jgi:hypothetical protein
MWNGTKGAFRMSDGKLEEISILNIEMEKDNVQNRKLKEVRCMVLPLDLCKGQAMVLVLLVFLIVLQQF